jgi:hypothetical protein
MGGDSAGDWPNSAHFDFLCEGNLGLTVWKRTITFVERSFENAYAC